MQLGESLAVLGKQLRARFDDAYTCLTPALDQTLVVIAAEQGITVTRIARALLISPGAATQHIAALEKEGMVCRLTGQKDRREIVVELTPKGRELHKRIRARRLALLKHVFQGLEAGELQQLCDLITQAANASPPINTKDTD